MTDKAMRSNETRIGWWFMRNLRPREVARRMARNRVRAAAVEMAQANLAFYEAAENGCADWEAMWRRHGEAHDALCVAVELDYAAHGKRITYATDKASLSSAGQPAPSGGQS